MRVQSSLWEILIPSRDNNGVEIPLRLHRRWDDAVHAISHGLSVMSIIKGQWVNKSGHSLREEMIPVRFLATESEAMDIAEMTIDFYEQQTVMMYLVSDRVYMVESPMESPVESL